MCQITLTFMEKKGEVVFYQVGKDNIRLEVTLEKDTVWLTQAQMQQLFQQTKQNISLHIKNIFNEGELTKESTVKDYLTVRQEGSRQVKRTIEQYSLDVIISVGYRVKSRQGTDFRIWANKILKDYLTKGYALDKRRLEDQTRQLEELKQTVKLLGHVAESKPLNTDEATGLLKVLTDYSYALDVLDRYDHQVLEIEATSPRSIFRITYSAAMDAIKN